MNIYVGNLDYGLQEDELKVLFNEYGQVASVKIIKDKYTGRGKGFGFVEMVDVNEASNAINELDGAELKNRKIIVNKARPERKIGF